MEEFIFSKYGKSGFTIKDQLPTSPKLLPGISILFSGRNKIAKSSKMLETVFLDIKNIRNTCSNMYNKKLFSNPLRRHDYSVF